MKLDGSKYKVFATDYDGTLAHHGTVDAATLRALQRLREAGFRLLLVTGRQMPELAGVFPEVATFDMVVAENGALLCWPSTGTIETLAKPPDPRFVQKLTEHGVGPIATGHVIVATWEPHGARVLEVIQEMGLELAVIFNKGAVMILPTGVNKASGLQAALSTLGLTTAETIGVGDAENDHAFLEVCGFGVAVANALPSLKEKVDMVTGGEHCLGVQELISRILGDQSPPPPAI